MMERIKNWDDICGIFDVFSEIELKVYVMIINEKLQGLSDT